MQSTGNPSSENRPPEWGGIQRLVLTLDGGPKLNRKRDGAAFLSERLPTLRRSRRYPYSGKTRTLPAKLRKRFPTILRDAVSEHEYYSDYRFSEFMVENQIRCSLAYVFDKSVLTYVGELLNDPRAIAIPPDLLPLLPEEGGFPSSSLTYRFSRLPSYRWTPEMASASRAILGAAEGALKAGVPVSITMEEREDHPRRSLTLTRISELRASDLTWHAEILPGDEFKIWLEAAGVGKNTRWYDHFAIDPESRTLYFHEIPDLIWRIIGRGQDAQDLLEFEPQIVAGGEGFKEILQRLQTEYADTPNAYILHAERETLVAGDAKPRLWIDEKGDFSFSLDIATQKKGDWRVWNFSESGRDLARLLTEGIGEFLQIDAKSLAARSNLFKRTHDLKLIRHHGVAALLLLRVGEILQQGEIAPSDGNKKMNKLLEALKPDIARCLISANEEDFQPLDFLCSGKVEKLIDQAANKIRTIFEREEVRFWPNYVVTIEGHGRVVLEIFCGLVRTAMERSNFRLAGKTKNGVFQGLGGYRSRAAFFEARPTDDISGALPPQALTYAVHFDKTPGAENTLSALLPLANAGYEILYGGKALATLNPEDFNFSLELQENLSDFADAGFSTPRRIDWFELHPRFFFRGVELSGEVAQNFARTGVLEFHGKFYRLLDKKVPAMRRLEGFWHMLQHGKNAKNGPREKTTIYTLPYHQVLEMLALRAQGVPVRGGKHWDEVSRFYDELDRARPRLELPPQLRVKLKPYQEAGVQWLHDLYRLGLGGILADDMGLGKTVQALAFLEILRSRGELGKVLVVVPTSLTYNWQSESARFTPEIPVQIFRPRAGTEIGSFVDGDGPALLIVTYGLLQEHAEFFTSRAWDIALFDEAQSLKNLSAQRTTTARKLKARFKLCLTGTPMENHFEEFYSLLDLTVPGCLGDLAPFRLRYVKPETLLPADVETLKLKTRPLVLRRTKSAILRELPAKTETTVRLPFPEKQRLLYREVALAWNEKVQKSLLLHGKVQSQLAMLTALLRLRQVCSDPQALPGIDYPDVPPKVALLTETVTEIVESGESALVFTQFLETFSRTEKELRAAGIRCFSMSGHTSRTQRARILADFNAEEKGAVLLMTLKTGGVGLNLVKASYVFHLEPWWNPAVENQATDRSHRLGQKRPVQVYRYLMEGSVEEKIEKLKARKDERFRALFAGAEEDESQLAAGSSMLSREDFEFLLS